MTEVSEQLRKLLGDLLVLKPEEVRPELLLVDDLDADSITFLELWFTLEHDFGLELPEVQANEETFNLPLLEGLARLEKLGDSKTFFEFVRREVVVRGLPMAPGLDTETVRAALDPAQREQIFRNLNIGTLAALVGGRVPDRLDADAPITELRLKDFFRFLTVQALVEYVAFLSELQHAAEDDLPSPNEGSRPL